MKASQPTSRPVWVLILSSLMLLTGGYSLIAGMLKFRDPAVVLATASGDSAGTDAEVELTRRIAAARLAAVAPRRNAVRAEAVAEIAIALFTLYATAAVISRNRHGRLLSIAVGALGIAYQLITLPVYLSLMRDYAARGSELLAQAIIQSSGQSSGVGTTLTGPDVAHRLRSAIVGGPIVVAAIGVCGSLVLMVFFGGRRGRALYGLEAPRK